MDKIFYEEVRKRAACVIKCRDLFLIFFTLLLLMPNICLSGFMIFTLIGNF